MILITFCNNFTEIVGKNTGFTFYSTGNIKIQPHSGKNHHAQTHVSPYLPVVLNPGNSIASVGVGMIKTTARPISSSTMRRDLINFFDFMLLPPF